MIENLNKFEIAEKINELKESLNDQKGLLFNLSQRFGVYEEVMSMPLDKDGGVPGYYISETLEHFLKVHEDIKDKEQCEPQPPEDIFTDDFFGTLFTKKYGKQ